MLLQLLRPRAALVTTTVHPILRHQSQMASLFGYTGVAEPEFEVLKKGAGYEVRKYGPQIRALTQQPQGKGNGPAFRTLAGYIFGSNTAKGSDKCEKIAMTAPVAMSMPNKGESIAMTAPVSMQGETMSFVMPAKYKFIDELPIPKSADVKLIEVPAAQYAVIRFSGLLSEGQIIKHEAKLREAATTDGLTLSTNPGDVQVWGFNPPWTLPFARRNEVAIPLTTPL